jgi:hypothetical protein
VAKLKVWQRLAIRLVVLTALGTGLIPVAQAGTPKPRTSQGKTVDEVTRQAAAESMRGTGTMKVTGPHGKVVGESAATTSMMPAAMSMATQATTVQGPTGLPTNVGGSWNNYAFTIPSSPYAPSSNGPSGAVHAVELYDGKVLIMAGSGNQWENLQAKDFTSWVWDPTLADQTKAWKFIPTPYDMFCAGHTILPNGNVLVTGGTTAYPQYDSSGKLIHDWDGSKQSYYFDVASEQYVQTGSMANARWYPTAISVGGGKVLVTGGLDDQAKPLGVVSHNTDTTELYDPATGKWTTLPTLDFSLNDPSTVVAPGAPNSTRTLPFYPGLTLLKGGKLFYSGESNGDNGVQPGIWNYRTGQYTTVPALPFNYQRNAGATILLPPAQTQKVMVMGGGDYSLGSTADTEIIDLLNAGTSSNPTPTWTKGPAMSAAKMYVGSVILPNSTVFETNGAAQFRQTGVHTAEIYNPTSNTFTVMNSPAEDRLYHSNAFLEPNGQVAVMGSQPLDGSFNMHIAIYSPPYLFKGTQPTVTGTLNQFDYSGTAQGKFTIATQAGATVGSASLIRPSATTHSTDPDQRLISLAITKNADGTYSFTPPTDDTLAPEGQYMLFVTDSNGVPSVAKWVSIGVPAAGGTTTPPAIGLTLALTTMSGWVATLTSQAPTATAGQDITLQVRNGTTWQYATNNLTDATGKTRFTWGGGTTLQLRAVLGTLVSNTVTVTYGP